MKTENLLDGAVVQAAGLAPELDQADLVLT